jgi:hypothetical protein
LDARCSPRPWSGSADTDAVEHEGMEVQIEIERAAESLCVDEGSRAAVRQTGSCSCR